MDPRRYTYNVDAVAWTNGGSGKVWKGSVTVEVRADSSHGLAVLQQAVGEKANKWLREQGFAPANRVELEEWHLAVVPRRR